MNIEEIKNRLNAYMASFKNYNEKHHETVEDEFRFHAPSDIEFLLAENQRLVEERDSFQRVGIKAQEVNVRLVEALEKITEEINIDSNDSAVLMGKAAITLNNYRLIAKVALESYRQFEKDITE